MKRELNLEDKLIHPPNESIMFYPFTFFAKHFCGYDIFLVIPWDQRDTYWKWLNDNNCKDNIKDLISDYADISIFKISLLTCETLPQVLQSIGFDLRNYTKKSNTIIL